MAKKKIKNSSFLEKQLGVSKNQLSNILSNKYSPIKANVSRLAEYLDVSPLEIIKEIEEKK